MVRPEEAGADSLAGTLAAGRVVEEELMEKS
jgi:hypothetical protein